MVKVGYQGAWEKFTDLRCVRGDVTGYWKDLFEAMDKAQRWNCFYRLFNRMQKDGQNVGRIAQRFDIPLKFVKEVLGRKHATVRRTKRL